MTTITDVLGQAADASARRDIELVLGHVLQQSRAYIFAHGERQLSELHRLELEALLKRLACNEPPAYILNAREFYGLNLYVSKSVLIPRPETELLVEYALENASPGAAILDLGTGSGAIAVALAAQKRYSITASDICSKALTVAKRNADSHDCSIQFIKSDWFEALHIEFDMILCNPPYIAESDMIDTTVSGFEPEVALFAGEDGLDALRQVIAQAIKHLAPGGVLAVEHGWQQAPIVTRLFLAEGYTKIRTLEDLAGLGRVTLGKLIHPHE